MNMFARFDKNPAMTLQDIKKTNHYGRTDARTDGRTDVKTVYPPQTKFAGGIIKRSGHLSAIIVFYFEFEILLKFYNLQARSSHGSTYRYPNHTQ